jgi:hypothetical protein
MHCCKHVASFLDEQKEEQEEDIWGVEAVIL